MTFIATKTDDISTPEIINTLQLEKDPRLRKIEDQMKFYSDRRKRLIEERKQCERKISGK